MTARPASAHPAPAHRPVAGRGHGRVPTANATAAEQRRALVRYIAADPLRIQWLREHVAAHLDRAADSLAESTLADLDAAEVLHARAGAHRRGDTSLW